VRCSFRLFPLPTKVEGAGLSSQYAAIPSEWQAESELSRNP